MGNRITAMPKYIRDFNVENRAAKVIDLDKIKQSPRHPSTVEIFKKKEDATPQVDEREQNKKIVESNVKVFGGGQIKIDSVDKRPRKENEMKHISERNFDIDYDKYGYAKPDKIKPGQITLRHFDEMINEYKQAKKVTSSSDNVDAIEEALSKKYQLDKATLKNLIHYYKPFNVINNNQKAKQMPPIDEIFPNVKNLEANISEKK